MVNVALAFKKILVSICSATVQQVRWGTEVTHQTNMGQAGTGTPLSSPGQAVIVCQTRGTCNGCLSGNGSLAEILSSVLFYLELYSMACGLTTIEFCCILEVEIMVILFIFM